MVHTKTKDPLNHLLDGDNRRVNPRAVIALVTAASRSSPAPNSGVADPDFIRGKKKKYV